MYYRSKERFACEENLENLIFKSILFYVSKFVIDIIIWSIDLLNIYILILTLLKKMIVAL